MIIKKLSLLIFAFVFMVLSSSIIHLAYADGHKEKEQKMIENLDPNNSLVLKLKDGDVYIELFEDTAPKHVKRIKELVEQKFYDGIVFHRVIDGFMAQTGDPTGTGTGGSGQSLKAEFNDRKHVRGTVSMARAMSPDSADSQFFICFDDTPHLDGQYTVWGQVVSGMEFVDNIKKGDEFSGEVKNPDKIISLKLLKDAK